MSRNVLNGVFVYNVKEAMRLSADLYVKSMFILDINEKPDDDYYFVVDMKGNICIFDYVIQNEQKSNYGKCYLAYEIDECYNFFNLVKVDHKNGKFICIDGNLYDIKEVCDNQKLQIIKWNGSSTADSTQSHSIHVANDNASLDMTSGSSENRLLYNRVVFNEDSLCYFYEKTLKYTEYKLEWAMEHGKTMAKLISAYVKAFTLLNHTQTFCFIVTSKNEQKHYCNVISSGSGLVVVFSMPECFTNFGYVNSLLFNRIIAGDRDIVQQVFETRVFRPCNIILDVVGTCLVMSTESQPPKIDIHHSIVLKIMACFLNERRIVFYSANARKIYKTIIFFILIIRPFSYEFFISSQLPDEIKEILDSPFPFVLGTCKRLKTSHVFVDLDAQKLDNYFDDILPFEKKLKNKFNSSIHSDINTSFRLVFKYYFTIIRNNLDMAKETLINKNLTNSSMLRKLICKPEMIKAEIKYLNHNFTEGFVETRIFKDYINGQKNGLVFTYTADFMEKDSNIIKNTMYVKLFSHVKYKPVHYVKINANDPFIYMAFLKFYRGCLREFVHYFANKQDLLKNIATEVLSLFSEQRKYEDICWFVKLLKNRGILITPDMFSSIHYGEAIHFNNNEVFNLKEFTISVFVSCQCGILSENTSNHLLKHVKVPDSTHTVVFADKNIKHQAFFTQRIGTVNNPMLIDTEIKHFQTEKNALSHFDKCKHCYNGIIVEKTDRLVGTFGVISPRDLFMFVKRGTKTRISDLNNNIFWNLITYFLIYNLPINVKRSKDENHHIITIEEHNGKRLFNFLNLPTIKFIN